MGLSISKLIGYGDPLPSKAVPHLPFCEGMTENCPCQRCGEKWYEAVEGEGEMLLMTFKRNAVADATDLFPVTAHIRDGRLLLNAITFEQEHRINELWRQSDEFSRVVEETPLSCEVESNILPFDMDLRDALVWRSKHEKFDDGFRFEYANGAREILLVARRYAICDTWYMMLLIAIRDAKKAAIGQEESNEAGSDIEATQKDLQRLQTENQLLVRERDLWKAIATMQSAPTAEHK